MMMIIIRQTFIYKCIFDNGGVVARWDLWRWKQEPYLHEDARWLHISVLAANDSRSYKSDSWKLELKGEIE